MKDVIELIDDLTKYKTEDRTVLNNIKTTNELFKKATESTTEALKIPAHGQKPTDITVDKPNTVDAVPLVTTTTSSVPEPETTTAVDDQAATPSQSVSNTKHKRASPLPNSSLAPMHNPNTVVAITTTPSVPEPETKTAVDDQAATQSQSEKSKAPSPPKYSGLHNTTKTGQNRLHVLCQLDNTNVIPHACRSANHT